MSYWFRSTVDHCVRSDCASRLPEDSKAVKDQSQQGVVAWIYKNPHGCVTPRSAFSRE